MKYDISVKVLRALGDEIRLGIVKSLAGECSPVSGCVIVNSCAQLTKLSQPTISHHFNKLVEAGVLIEGKDGISKHYEINHQLLESVGIEINKL